MDNLTHSLAGAVLGQMGLKKKTGLAMPTLIIASNIPDIDALAVLLGGHTHLAIRRGITHGPIAMLLLPLILWAIMLWFDRWQERRGKRPEKRLPIHRGWLLALAFIGTLSHPAMDWLNSYGVRLLEPFSSLWFYGDSIFIIDIWIWAALIAGVWLSLRRENRGQGNWQRPAWVSFAAVCAYIFANGAITTHAEAKAKYYLENRVFEIAGDSVVYNGYGAEVVANPVPVQFWKREILWRNESAYGSGDYDILNPSVLRNEQAASLNNWFPAADIIGASKEASAYMFWSRMPVITNIGDEVTVRDQRFSNPLVGDRFTLRVNVRKGSLGTGTGLRH